MNDTYTFSLIALLLVISPGPNGVLILKTVSAEGKFAGFLNILGLTSATFVHGAFSIFGLSTLILHSAELFLLVKVIGASYLFYIGIKTIVTSFKKKKVLQPEENPHHLSKKEKSKHIFYFLSEGFITQLLNPKVSMFYLAAFPQFISFDQPHYLDAFTLVTIHASIIFFWFLGVSQLVGFIKSISTGSLLGRWLQRASGSLLVYFGGLLLSQQATK